MFINLKFRFLFGPEKHSKKMKKIQKKLSSKRFFCLKVKSVFVFNINLCFLCFSAQLSIAVLAFIAYKRGKAFQQSFMQSQSANSNQAYGGKHIQKSIKHIKNHTKPILTT